MNLIRWIPAIVWAAFIAVICLLPHINLSVPRWLDRFHPDKMVHFFLFLILAILILIGTGIPIRRQWTFFILGFLLFLAMYGGLIELAQGWFTSTRRPEIFDWIADIAGATFGLVLFMLIIRNDNRKNRD